MGATSAKFAIRVEFWAAKLIFCHSVYGEARIGVQDMRLVSVKVEPIYESFWVCIKFDSRKINSFTEYFNGSRLN